MQLATKVALKIKVEAHLAAIYPDVDVAALAARLIGIMKLNEDYVRPEAHESRWSEEDIWVITYGDSIRGDSARGDSARGDSVRGDSDDADAQKPLQHLRHFLNTRLKDVVNGVHVLPFFPFSSDDGFSVIDFSQVNESLGTWEDIQHLGREYHLMGDLVVNHCSSRSRWFENYKKRVDPGKDYFVEVESDFDVSQVVRPRTSPLLREVNTLDGERQVWCTFSHDQVDLNYANPELLCEMVQIIKQYLDNGVRIFRLDAVAFLWKESGTRCVHLNQTHEMVRLFRTLIEHHSSDAILITETNVPNHENLSYFGNANEAHAVYNFTLPPLLLQGLLTGNCAHLTAWLSTMPPSQMGTFYFNFIASHDGIGLRPVEGYLSDEEVNEMVNCVKQFGARISWRTSDDGRDKPYEINVTLFDALQGTTAGPDRWQLARFLCAHGVMLAMEGVPAIYIHSLLGTNNYYHGVEHTNHNRTINRYKWDELELLALLDDDSTHHAKVFSSMKRLMAIRKQESCFHPNAEQFVLHISDQIFGFWRQNIARTEAMFCLFNFSDQEQSLPLTSLNLPGQGEWMDLVSEQLFQTGFETVSLMPYQFVWLKGAL